MTAKKARMIGKANHLDEMAYRVVGKKFLCRMIWTKVTALRKPES